MHFSSLLSSLPNLTFFFLFLEQKYPKKSHFPFKYFPNSLHSTYQFLTLIRFIISTQQMAVNYEINHQHTYTPIHTPPKSAIMKAPSEMNGIGRNFGDKIKNIPNSEDLICNLTFLMINQWKESSKKLQKCQIQLAQYIENSIIQEQTIKGINFQQILIRMRCWVIHRIKLSIKWKTVTNYNFGPIST